MATETSEDLVKRLMSEIRAHGKAMEASSSTNYERRDSGPGREEVRDVDIYDNNATFVIRKPVDRKSDHTFLTLNNSGSPNGKISSSYQHHNQSHNHNHHLHQTPILSSFLSHPTKTSVLSSSYEPTKLNGSTPETTKSTSIINRNYAPQITSTTSPTVANGNLIKGESDVSCYSSISSTGAVDPMTGARPIRNKPLTSEQLMCDQRESQCTSCGLFLGASDSEPISSDVYMVPNGISVKSPMASNRNQNDHVYHTNSSNNQHGHSLMKCDHIGPINSVEDPPRYSPNRFYNGPNNANHHHHHHNERLGPKVFIPLPKPPSKGKSLDKGVKHLNDKLGKSKYPLKYIKKVTRCPGCSGKCYIEPLQRSMNHLSAPAGDNLFTLYCPSCSKTGLNRYRSPGENGNFIFNGSMDKHLTYYSALPRLWDTDMWHRKRKRASIRKNEKILIVFTSIVSMVIFMTLTYLGVTTFQKITELPKLG